MGTSLRTRVENALREACRDVAGGRLPPLILQKPRRTGHGDLSTNIALLLAKEKGAGPRDIAQQIADRLMERTDFHPEVCEKIEVAGAGFLNIFLSPSLLHEQLKVILQERDDYGGVRPERPHTVLIEYVSANPTGPLTVAHGRQAAVGDSLARILTRAGCSVAREYYLNDKGKQVRTLGFSALQRYRELFGQKVEIPDDGYRGEYVKEIAARIKARDGDRWLGAGEEEAITFFSDYSSGEIVRTIIKDLDDFRAQFDHWTSEKEFSASGKVEECLAFLRGRGFIYDREGAVWFRSSALGDDKDRVLVKSDGERTYFAPDIAYHRDKFARGFDRLIDLWGPDHHGYVARMKAAVSALGYDGPRFTPVIVQLTTLFRGKRKLSMSTRMGEFVTLREVMDEVGVDAARYFLVRMRTDSHLNFDLELATKRSNDNPVYYVQYVHARICSIFKRLAEKKPGLTLPPWENVPLGMLRQDEELNLLTLLSDFPCAVEYSAEALEPHQLCNYLEELAAMFHQCYTRHTVISDDPDLTAARLALAEGVRIIVRNGLCLLGVSAPEQM
ncbi:MAG: arginine--tRNA ligase [Candidatus Aureabacteria bacterium]|nr:arginine--tRNA ligase [Candidatus Auribacterota bacterium]